MGQRKCMMANCNGKLHRIRGGYVCPECDTHYPLPNRPYHGS